MNCPICKTNIMLSKKVSETRLILHCQICNHTCGPYGKTTQPPCQCKVCRPEANNDR